MLPYDTDMAIRELKYTLEDINVNDQKLFLTVMTVVHTADSKKQLDIDTETIRALARDVNCGLSVLKFQQYDGMVTAIPYGHRKVDVFRTFNTQSVAIFMPFRVQEIYDRHGIYYGQNVISKNMMIADRRRLLNGNSFILGVSGSGKSFTAKNENESGGSLIVNSGNVKAYGAKYGAGIGGGINRGNNLITINGGYVYAKGGDYGAGIGASEGGSAGPVTINGGKVDAYGGLKAAGIGGGQNWHGGGDGGTVIIYGGEVYAEGSDYGAGIGGGEDGNGGSVYIYGGKVTAKAGEDASGIGGGDNGNGGSVYIYGGTVAAESTSGDTCAIGNGDGGYSKGTLKIGENQKVSSERLFYEYERESACQYRYKVRIESCEHPVAATFMDITDSTHLRTPCPYCGHHYKAEPHTYDLEHNKCTLCNYQGQLFTIRFVPNGGSGTMTTVEVVPEEIYRLGDQRGVFRK